MDISRIRVTGRCPTDGGVLWLTFSLSEAAFTLRGGTHVCFTMRGEERTDEAARNVAPRFAVEIGGKRVLDTRLMTETAVYRFSVAPSEEEVPVRLVKLSECTQSILGLEDIETDGRMSPMPERALRIEFIGDSITCGYGVEAESGEETFSTATENAEKGYAGILCGALGAAPMLTAFSGHGLVSGYTGDPAQRNMEELVPPYYETCGRQGFRLPSGRLLQEIPWDFGRARPDAIVLNLGTNDLSWCQRDPERHRLFETAYGGFLRTVRRNNPGVPILCVLGLMGTGLNEEVARAVRQMRAETGDVSIRCMTVEEQDFAANGAGADFHPSAATQRQFAAQVLKALTENGFIPENTETKLRSV